MAAIVYSPGYHIDLGAHVFPTAKYHRLHDSQIERRLAAPSDWTCDNLSIRRAGRATSASGGGAMEEGRATVLVHEEIYAGTIFTVVRDRVRLPKGVDATLEVVRHPGSVVLLPMPDRDHVILVKQYRYAVDRWVWELAAGSLKPGEDPAQGAARECEEETGLAAGRVEFVGAFYPTPGYCDEKMNFFRLTLLAPPVGRPAASPDDDEDIRVRRFSLAEIRSMIARGEIDDLKTVAGLALL